MFNKFFSDRRYMPQLQRYSRTKLCDGAKMAIFCVLYFSEPRAAHSKFSLMCGSMVDIQSPTAEIRRGNKERKKEDRKHRAKI